MPRRRKVEVTRSKRDGKWYWHLLAANGRVLDDSGQGYVRKGYCVNRAVELNPTALLVVVD